MSKDAASESQTSWRLKAALGVLGVLVLVLQFSLWLGDHGVFKLRGLENKVTAQRQANAELAARNRRLQAEVVDLKRGTEALEERARSRLGMIKKDETFYQILETDPTAGND